MKKNANTNALEIPFDVKFVNGLTSVLFGVFLFLILLISAEYFIKNKIKSLDKIVVKGAVLHNDFASVKNIIANNINANLYSVNLMKTKQLFESMPWINQAIVKRVYPSQIEVKLSEYKLKAIWGAREDVKLVDETGVIFEASIDDDEYDQMPQLIGPEGQGKLMLDTYKEVSIALTPLKTKLKILELNARGSWMATLDGGAHIELGRGSAMDIIERIKKFSTSVEQMLTKLNKKSKDIQYIDLRHFEGYAMRMQGISTLDTVASDALFKK